MSSDFTSKQKCHCIAHLQLLPTENSHEKLQWVTAITQHQRHHHYIKHYIQENRRVTAQNVLMTYAKLLLSDSSSSSPVPSSWNNHKLTPSVNSGTPVWGLHGDLNIPCSSAAPVQNAECSMIPLHIKKQFVFAFLRAACADLSKPRFTTGWLCLP